MLCAQALCWPTRVQVQEVASEHLLAAQPGHPRTRQPSDNEMFLCSNSLGNKGNTRVVGDTVDNLTAWIGLAALQK